MTYEEALAAIAALEPRGWRLGLDRMAEFCARAGLNDALGAPGGPQYLHIAGTNGKGSVTAYLQSILVESGLRTGAFFSPYVVDPRERVQIGREMISPSELAARVEELLPVAESLVDTPFGGVTEFEMKTAIGFATWKRAQCDWVALEVGLGGRLDATNVVSSRASAIVSIGLDHQAILGQTLGEIASEKAGIVKPNTPVVLGEMPAEALAAIELVASRRRAPVWRFRREVRLAREGDEFCVDTPRGRHSGLRPGLRGTMRAPNMAVAVAMLDAAGIEVDEAALARGVSLARIPGRFETRRRGGREIVVDGAHNPDAARVLRRSLEEAYPGRRATLVTNMVAGHDPADFYGVLAPVAESAFVPPIAFHRALRPAEVAANIEALGVRARPVSSIAEALEEASAAAGPSGLVLATGSFYLVGEVLRALEPARSR